MADKCPHCRTGVGPLATKCYKCGGDIGPEAEMAQNWPTLEQKERAGKLLIFSIIFGILGIALSPTIWIFIVGLSTSAVCGMYLISGISGLLAFIIGIMLILKNKDMRGVIGVILAIVTGILILIPIFFVMTTSFG